MPTAIAVAAAALLLRRRLLDSRHRLLDASLIAVLACPLVQLVPLPSAVVRAVSPSAPGVNAALRLDAGARRFLPLSIDPAATLKAAAVAGLVVLTFWTARALFEGGSVRRVARAVAWSALAVSVVAMLTRRLSASLVYGVFDAGASAPFGPFINRNHMGTWLVMALPVTVGYLFARLERHAREEGGMVAGLDAPLVWTLGAAAASGAALIGSLSRSAVIGALAAGLVLSAAAWRRRRFAMSRLFVPAALAFTAAIALALPVTAQLAGRFADSRTSPEWAREEIWRETLPIVEAFPATGVGLGGYRAAMLVYQQADRRFFFNQAHDQYLQLAAEGGLLLWLPLAIAAWAFARELRTAARTDLSAAFWIRAGAMAGIAGALVQSVWETGLRMPANGMLFAVACAIAISGREASGSTSAAPR